jgi:predicted DNA-binding transcriptional regulator AlpA
MRRLITRWPPRFMRTPEAARFLGLSTRTLEKHRCCGTGPRYRKLGGRIVYAYDDLLSPREDNKSYIPCRIMSGT